MRTEHNVYSMFNSKDLHDMWPSSDPKAEPFTEYTCKLCGEKLTFQTCGSMYMGQPTFGAVANEGLREHLLVCHCSDRFIAGFADVDLMTANSGFDKLLMKEVT